MKDREASFDGNVQNSGIIGQAFDGSGTLTPHGRARYNELITRYSERFLPPLQTDAGIRPLGTNYFLIDAEHLTDFETMNRWHKSAAP